MLGLFNSVICAYNDYIQRVNTLALALIIITIIAAIVLHISNRKKACIILIICGTIFWLFGGYFKLANFFVG